MNSDFEVTATYMKFQKPYMVFYLVYGVRASYMIAKIKSYMCFQTSYMKSEIIYLNAPYMKGIYFIYESNDPYMRAKIKSYMCFQTSYMNQKSYMI